MIEVSEISAIKSPDAFDRFLKERYNGDAALFVSDINGTVNRTLQTNLKQVKVYLGHLSTCFNYLPRFHRPRLLAIEARYLHWSGESKKALRLYGKAVEQLNNVRNFDAAARARQGLMDVRMYLGDYQEALRTGKRALNYFQRKGNEYNAARVLTNIGNIYHRLDRNRMALKYYNKAHRYFKKKGGIPLAILDFNRANIHTNLNQLDLAEELYGVVARQFREGGMDLAAGKAEYSLAYLYFLKDKYTLALKTFDRVIEIFESSDDKKSAAVTLLDLTEINIHLNQYGSAVMSGEKALNRFRDLRMRYEQAKAAYFVSETYRLLGDHQISGKYLNRAEKLFKLEKNSLWLGMVQITRARLLMSVGKFIKAREMARTAYANFKRSSDRRRSVDARTVIMAADLRQGDYQGVLRLGHLLLQKKLLNYQKHDILNICGEASLAIGNPKRALGYYRKAITIIEKMLENIFPDEIRYFFAFDKYPTYLSAVNCMLKTKNAEKSFLQHSKAMALLNRRPVPIDTIQEEVPEHLLDAHDRLRASLKRLDSINTGNQRQIESSRTLYREEHRLWDTERKIRSYLYPAASAESVKPGLSPNYREMIGKDEILINFITVERKIGAFCVSPEETRYVSCHVTENELETNIREFHFLMEMAVHHPGGNFRNKEVIRQYLEKLHSILIRPLGLSGNVKKIILLLDGVLAQIPFPALIDHNGGWLKDEYELRAIINPDDLQRSWRNRNFSLRAGNAIFAPANSGLPATIQEGQNIKKVFPSARIYLDQRANIENLRQELQRAGGFVHIATHASRSSENPLFSRIMMQDGPFFPFDLFGAGIKARLVTLSGCQTAAPGIYYGNSFSLAKAFYTGGADSVLASLWPISDKVSLIFMTEFYKALRNTKNISTAFQKALNETCAINDNPAFWAPFVMLGM